MFCSRILRSFGEKSQNRKTRKSGHFRILRRSVGNPCCGVDLRQGVGYPHRGEAEVPKWHPSGMPRRSKAKPHRRSTLQRSSATPWRKYSS